MKIFTFCVSILTGKVQARPTEARRRSPSSSIRLPFCHALNKHSRVCSIGELMQLSPRNYTTFLEGDSTLLPKNEVIEGPEKTRVPREIAPSVTD